MPLTLIRIGKKETLTLWSLGFPAATACHHNDLGDANQLSTVYSAITND